MATSTGNQLAITIRQGINELKEVCSGLDEAASSRAPEGRWSPKEILSHLLGPEEAGHMQILQAFLDRHNPRIEIEPSNSFFSEKRARMALSQLLAAVESEYTRMSQFVESLSQEQLDRKACIPLLKDTPFGEYPSLATWVGVLGGFEESHLKSHINHMREVLEGLDVPAK